MIESLPLVLRLANSVVCRVGLAPTSHMAAHRGRGVNGSWPSGFAAAPDTRRKHNPTTYAALVPGSRSPRRVAVRAASSLVVHRRNASGPDRYLWRIPSSAPLARAMCCCFRQAIINMRRSWAPGIAGHRA
jgi:hypothetical protein